MVNRLVACSSSCLIDAGSAVLFRVVEEGKLSFDYEANPAEPSRPQKSVKIASYESLW